MKGLNRRLLAVACALVLLPSWASAQEPVRITGRVTNEAGAPLASASIFVQGLNIGTEANAEGRYLLLIPGARIEAGQSVQLSAQVIGYGVQTVTVTLQPGATITQDFSLSLDPLRLTEIVVTGAGTQARAERLGTARSSVDAATIARTNEVNVVQALAGKSANVQTTQQGGEPGASTAIRIRGPKTINGTSQPTFIVDGVVISNQTRVTGPSILQGGVATNRAMDINPEDIESIEILKGAAAASIYGASAGTAGAVIITTKRGAAGRTRYSLRSTTQFDSPLRYIPLQRKYGMGTKGVATGRDDVDYFVGSGFQSWGPELAPGTPTYDHVRELYETGMMFDNTINISGGSERTTFYLSVGGMNHDGFIVQNADRYNRYTLRFNGSHQFTDNLTVAANASYVQTNGSFVGRGNSVNGLLLGALRTPPEFNNKVWRHPESGLHRSYRFPNPSKTSLIANRGFDNPFFVINEAESTGETGRIMGNVNVDWRPLDWLNLAYTIGVDYNSDDRLEAFHVSSSGAASGGQLDRWQFYDRVIDHNLRATANYTLNDNISGTFTVGQNLNETYFRQINVVGRGLIAPRPYKLSNTTSRDTPTDSENRRRLEGYFFQGTMDIADQLFLTARLRNDGASTFGVDNQRAWYPGASIAWSFSKTLNIPEESFLSFGKLRAAVGQNGNQPPLYILQSVYNGSTAPFGDFNPGASLVPTLDGIGGLYTSGTKGNPAIKPERGTEYEFGADLAFFGGRADLSVTYYTSDNRDVILNVPLPPSTGYTSEWRNAARIENKGWETALNARLIDKADVSLDLGLTWGKNKNKVLDLGDETTMVVGYSSSFTGSTTHAQVGEQLGVFRGFDFARCGRGLKQIGSHDIEAACAGKPDGALYIGPDGFPIQDPNEQVIGHPDPDWTAGLNMALTVKGVTLSAFLEHRQGGNTFNMTRGTLYQFGTHKDTEIRGQTRTFGKDFFPGEVVGPGAGREVVIGEDWFVDLGGVGGPRAQFMEDATHTRLREVSVAYSFRDGWVQRFGMSQIDLRVAGRNLALWTDYTGFDPEVNLGGAAAANRGIDWFVNPLSRAWVISLSLHR